jgi:hypothetical protein
MHQLHPIPQKKWRQSKGDFELWCKKIGWTTQDGDLERKKRWFGASEFIYDVKKLLEHPVWDNDDWKKQPE